MKNLHYSTLCVSRVGLMPKNKEELFIYLFFIYLKYHRNNQLNYLIWAKSGMITRWIRDGLPPSQTVPFIQNYSHFYSSKKIKWSGYANFSYPSHHVKTFFFLYKILNFKNKFKFKFIKKIYIFINN